VTRTSPIRHRRLGQLGAVLAALDWYKLRFWILIGFLVACFLFGGSSRPDNVLLLPLRAISLLCLLALLLLPGKLDFRAVRMPLLFLGAFAASMLIQLIPLPPSWWTALPGRDLYTVDAVRDVVWAWHPITLSPDRTWNSLIATLTPLIVLVGYAGLRNEQRASLVTVLLYFAGGTILLGAAQLAAGPNSAFFYYTGRSEGLPTGFLANRNHQAALLVCVLPILRLWVLMPARSASFARYRGIAALGIAAMLIPFILLTGSRMGTALILIGLIGAWAVRPVALEWKGEGRARLWGALAAVVLIAGVAALFVMQGRALSLDRLAVVGTADDPRVKFMPIVIDMARLFFPAGSGFGSFDLVFRGFEPNQDLRPTYFNNAHNDLAELALTGGLLAIAVLLAFVLWCGRQIPRVFRRRGAPANFSTYLARAGLFIILIFFLASLVDYPLRAPAISAVFAIAACWVAAHGAARGQQATSLAPSLEPGYSGLGGSGGSRPSRREP